MTVSSSTAKVSYTGDGATVTFSVPFYFLADGDLEVSVDSTVKTLATDYTVSGAGNQAGGSVTFTTAPASGTTVVIRRDMTITQEVDYVEGDPFPAATHEQALDRLTMIAQQLQEEGGRAVKQVVASQLSELTLPAPGAGQLIGWDAAGTALALYKADQIITQLRFLSSYSSPSDALTSIGSTVTMLVVDVAADWSGITTPDTLSLWWLPGAVGTGSTLTINGYLEAGKYQLFNLTGTGAVTFAAGAVPGVYPEWWGAVGDWDGSTGTDSTTAIQEAINSYDVVVCYGDYAINSMLELTEAKTLEVHGSLNRPSSSSPDPLVWLKGHYAALKGGGWIVSNSPSPSGVVLIGHRDLTQSHDNVLWCELENLHIAGMTAGGATSGSPDICVNIVNPQLNGYASYFHTLRNLELRSANVGIALQGWANGNSISDITFYYIGNTSVSPYVGLWINGAQENRIYDVFHHFSTDSYTIQVDELDNTANLGSVHYAKFNQLNHIVSEQGGSGARCLVVNTTNDFRSTYFVTANVSSSNILPTNHNQFNVVLNAEKLSLDEVDAFSSVTSKTISATNSSTLGIGVTSRPISLTGLSEAGKYAISDVTVTSGNSVVVEINGQVKSTTALRTSGVSGKWLVYYDGTTLYSRKIFTNHYGRYFTSDHSRFVEPVISGNVVTFGIYVGNNGSATTNNEFSGSITVIGDTSGIVVYDTATTVTSTVSADEISSSKITTPDGVFWSSGAGTPEGVVTAPVGSLFSRTDGGAGTTLYVKESGTGNLGWIAK